MHAAVSILIGSSLGRSLAKLLIALVVLVVLLFGWVLALLASVSASLLGAQDPAPAYAGGPVYHASTVNLSKRPDELLVASIHDLGFGPSDAARIDRMIARIEPNSPLVGTGQLLLRLGQQFRVDPLLIAQWQLESQMGTTGFNSPTNGGNVIWEAAKPYAATYGCTPGATGLGRVWTKCPSVPAGLGLWTNYVGKRYETFPNLEEYVNTYNPCSDPWNIKLGFECGTNYGHLLMKVVRTYADSPSQIQAGSAASRSCPPALPIIPARENLTLPPGVPEIAYAVMRGEYPMTHGFGPSDLPGEPEYLGYPDFHKGMDFSTPMYTPIYAPGDGVATQTGGPNVIVDLHLPNGNTWRFFHLAQMVAEGPVRTGDLLGYTGNSGYSFSPHLHLEMKNPDGDLVPPEHWACSSGVGGQR